MAGRHRAAREPRLLHDLIRRERAMALPAGQMMLVVLLAAVTAVLLLALLKVLVPTLPGAQSLQPGPSGHTAEVSAQE